MSEKQRNKHRTIIEEVNELSIEERNEDINDEEGDDDSDKINDKNDDDCNGIDNIIVSQPEENNDINSSNINAEDAYVDSNYDVNDANDDDNDDDSRDDANDDDDNEDASINVNDDDEDDSVDDNSHGDNNHVQVAILKNKSTNTILAIIEKFPMDVQSKNASESFYPLHTACYCGYEDVAIKLIELFPKAAEHKDSKGRYPLDIAITCNYLDYDLDDLVIKLVEIFPEAVIKSHSEDGTVLKFACQFCTSESIIAKLLEINPLATQQADTE